MSRFYAAFVPSSIVTIILVSALDAVEPDLPSHLIDFSYAGYRYGEATLPEGPATHRVADFGAVPGDGADDSAAIARAILAVERDGSGVLVLEVGVYDVSEVIRIHRSGVVLRGAGSGKTVLACGKSLSEMERPAQSWNWRGGLIWAAPTLVDTAAPFPAAPLAGKAERGAMTLGLDPGYARYLVGQAGRAVTLTWTGGEDMVRHILGEHPNLDGFDLKGSWDRLSDGEITFVWTVELAAVEGDRLTLKQPLRLDVRPEWDVRLTPVWQPFEEVGIEGMTIHFPTHEQKGHLQDPGFNGIFFENLRHGWIRDVAIKGADNGIFLEGSSHITIREVAVTGEGRFHHASSFRGGSHDNLMEDFLIEARTHHGISAQDMASGNVWRRGVMHYGTFDSHRGMPFDQLRSDIDIYPTGSWGGSGDAGPFVGRGVVHWNIRILSKPPEAKSGLRTKQYHPVATPEMFILGALVGIQGLEEQPHADGGIGLPTGDKGTVVLDWGKAPAIPDLYAWQLARRLGR